MNKNGARVDSTITVSRSFKIGDSGWTEPEAADEVIQVHVFQTQPAIVKFGVGLTRNMGNYESARLDVSVSVPCYSEHIEAAYAEARRWAEAKLKEEVDGLQGNMKKALF